MTQQEKQEIIAAVLDALQTNSKSIAQLTSVTELQDSDLIEVAGGRRVSYGTIKSLMETLFDGSIDDKLGENNELYFSESGRLRSTKATCVVLKSMGSILDNAFNDSPNQWSYIASVGDTYYDATTKKIVYYKAVDSLISSDPDGGLVYCNAHTNATYRWKGTGWEQVGGMGNDISVVNDLTTGGEDKALSAEMGVLLKANIVSLFNSLSTLYAKLGNIAFWSAQDKADAAPTALDWQVPKKTLAITNNIEHAVVKYNGVEVNSVQVDAGDTISLIVQGTPGWSVSSVSASGATVIDNEDGTFTVRVKVDGDMTLAISGTTVVVVVVVEFNLTGCSKTSGPDSVQEGGSATFVLSADLNYTMPLTLPSGAVTGAEVSSYTPSQDGSSATLIISNVTDDAAITIAATRSYADTLLTQEVVTIQPDNEYYYASSFASRACLLMQRSAVDNPCTWSVANKPSDANSRNDADLTTIPIPQGATKVSLQCDSAYYFGLTLVNASGVPQNTVEWTPDGTKKELVLADYPNATHICVNFKIGSAGSANFTDQTYSSMGIELIIE